MHTIQAADCEGTALTTTVTGVQIEFAGTVIAKITTLKTGIAPTGGRHRILTFVVLGPLGVQTYTRTPAGVRDDATGLLYAAPGERLASCRFCGGDVKNGGGRTVSTSGTVQLCTECLETIDATA